MARTEKGSRIRGLPPRTQLQQRDAVTGSYPTIARCASDNRTGTNKISFNDLYTPVFTYRDNMLWPSGVPSGSLYVTNEEHVTALSGVGSLRKGIGDQFYCGRTDILSGTHGPQGLKPFKDNTDRAVDARSWSCNDVPVTKLVTEKNYAFYATGSAADDVGEGFTAPLWSKQKIEIPIIVSKSSTIIDRTGSYGNNVSSSFRMAYYNFDGKLWEPIGQGLGIGSLYPGDRTNLSPTSYGNLQMALETFTCATAQSLLPDAALPLVAVANDGIFERTARFLTQGDVVSTFGFPSGPKYHATSSQRLNVSSYISEPFLLEKAVLTVSAAFNVGRYILSTSNITGADEDSQEVLFSAINTVFLLNQRRHAYVRYRDPVHNIDGINADIGADRFSENGFSTIINLPTSSVLTSEVNWTGPLTYVDTTRDIVCYSKVLSCAAGYFEKRFSGGSVGVSSSYSELQIHDVLISSSLTDISGINWDKKFDIEMISRTPAQRTQRNSYFSFGGGYSPTYNYPDGGRNGLGLNLQSGRSYGGALVSTTPVLTFTGSYTWFLPWTSDDFSVTVPFTYSVPNRMHKNDPYLLMPNDELVLCWCLPIAAAARGLEYDPNLTEDGNYSKITFAPGEYTLTLYGSYLSEGKESNDTLNQNLGSNSVSETIGNLNRK